MPEPPELERRLGLERYGTATPGVGGRLRVSPEDFVVEEIPRPPPAARGEGKYTVATVRAANWETNRLVREIGRRLRVSRRGIWFAGTKDKRAVKTQLLAILAPEERVRGLSIPGVEVLGTYRADRAPKIGELLGNRFAIVARELDVSPGEAERRCAATEEALRRLGGTPNFFGLQRFGSLRPVTQVVGARIVRGDFEGAVMAYVAEPQPGEPPEVYEARRRVGEERDFRKALTFYPQQLTFERVLLAHLAEEPGDWVGALRRLPQNLLTMFVYAYQSLLFNRILSARLALAPSLREVLEGDLLVPVGPDGTPDHATVVPVRAHNLEKCRRQAAQGRAAPTGLVFGLEAPLAGGVMGDAERRVIEAEGLRRQDFLVPALPEAASFGQRRALVVEPAEYRRAAEEGAMRFAFRLPKGSYATCLLREFLKTDPMRY